MRDEPAPEPPQAIADDFDGHLERPLSTLSPDERLDWIWTCMERLWAGEDARAKARTDLGGR